MFFAILGVFGLLVLVPACCFTVNHPPAKCACRVVVRGFLGRNGIMTWLRAVRASLFRVMLIFTERAIRVSRAFNCLLLHDCLTRRLRSSNWPARLSTLDSMFATRTSGRTSNRAVFVSNQLFSSTCLTECSFLRGCSCLCYWCMWIYSID